jgi:hypothetical protein
LHSRFDFEASDRKVTHRKHPMKFLLLCQVQPAAMANTTPEQYGRMMDAMQSYHQQLIQAAVLVSGGQLNMPHEGQRVYGESGRVHTQNGPALPGDTQIGGYYLLDVAAEQDATGWAAKCPIAHFGSLDVRQVIHSAS